MVETWTELLDAHERSRDPNRDGAPPHAPLAAVLACSDARIPPSVVFDQPAGTLFVVRIAGNAATPPAVASLDYAVEALGVTLVVVLGHTGCGAVAAAISGNCNGHFRPITGPICKLLTDEGHLDPDQLSERNVIATMTALAASPSPIGEESRAGTVEIRGAVYELEHDRVNPIPFTIGSSQPQPALEKP